jgi:hypothetical protein
MKGNDIKEAIEVFECGYYTQPVFVPADGTTKYVAAPSPSFRSIRRLKMSRSDYKPGKVRVYTEQEVKEYEDARV